MLFKKKQKGLTELFEAVIRDKINDPDFARKVEEGMKKRDKLYEGQRTDLPSYGYSLVNPIMTGSISKSDEYLCKLRTLDGEAFTWNRTGSVCLEELSGVNSVMIDEYQLYLHGKEYKTIYICPYSHTSSIAPQDMKLLE